jgi:hypothetical protein
MIAHTSGLKKLLPYMLSACFAFILSACGGSDGGSTTASTATPLLDSSSSYRLASSRAPLVGDAPCTSDAKQNAWTWVNKTNYTYKFTAVTGSKASPSVGTTILPGGTLKNINGLSWTIDIYDSTGATKLASSLGKLICASNNYIMDSNYLTVWQYNETASKADGYKNSWLDMETILAPPVITNSGWTSGMGNSLSVATEGNSFWGIDYGFEDGRWTRTGDAIYQLNKGIPYNGGVNYGSRAYPVTLGTDFAASPGPGGAMDGLWQIDIKVGTSGSSDNSYCETFYLAERSNPGVGTSNYKDGSPDGGDAGWGLEIDIMETRWNAGGTKLGPQINLPTGLGGVNTTFTGWTTDSTFYNTVLKLWSEIGGAPNADFATYGALIRGDSLWIYAYKPDGSVWYSTPEIKRSGEYKHTSPLYPYIGTWASPTKLGTKNIDEESKTGYKNYIYLNQDDSKIAGLNPYDNPASFGKTLLAK